jgi:hypothetical protein
MTSDCHCSNVRSRWPRQLEPWRLAGLVRGVRNRVWFRAGGAHALPRHGVANTETAADHQHSITWPPLLPRVRHSVIPTTTKPITSRSGKPRGRPTGAMRALSIARTLTTTRVTIARTRKFLSAKVGDRTTHLGRGGAQGAPSLAKRQSPPTRTRRAHLPGKRRPSRPSRPRGRWPPVGAPSCSRCDTAACTTEETFFPGRGMTPGFNLCVEVSNFLLSSQPRLLFTSFVMVITLQARS